MKLITLTNILLFLLSTTSCETNFNVNKDNDRAEMNIKGNVLIISESYFRATGTPDDYALTQQYGGSKAFSFNNLGNLTQETKNTFTTNYTYTYWDNGHLQTKTVTNYPNTEITKYDSKGRIIKEITKTALKEIGTRTRKTYNYGKNTKETIGEGYKHTTYYNEDQTIQKIVGSEETQIYKYNSQGQLIEIQNEGTSLPPKTFKYFPNGQLQKTTAKQADGEFSRNEYNEKGDLTYTKWFYTTSEGKGVTEKAFTYKYDKNDNWIESIESKFNKDKTSVIEQVTKRKIYYAD